jgi:hypothetical protein
MVCMDLVGHRLGPDQLPDEVGHTLFALGAERSTGTTSVVDALKRSEPGVIVRPIDAEIIPPLSDYDAFWRAEIPFLFLSAGRSRVYHTPADTPDRLDLVKIAATARWLTRFVDATRTRTEPIAFAAHAAGHATTLDELAELVVPLAPFSPAASAARSQVAALRAVCDREGRLPDRRYSELERLVHLLEAGLAG